MWDKPIGDGTIEAQSAWVVMDSGNRVLPRVRNQITSRRPREVRGDSRTSDGGGFTTEAFVLTKEGTEAVQWGEQ